VQKEARIIGSARRDIRLFFTQAAEPIRNLVNRGAVSFVVSMADNAAHMPRSDSFMNTRWKMAALIGYALIPTLLISSAAVADPASAGEPGIWQKHQYTFAFMGFTSTYSCDGLADKLKLLLIAAGARHDVKSRPGACATGFGRPDKFARADLTFFTLAPGAADAASGGRPVDGIWRPVAFADRSPRELSTGDCELVEQFRSNVLPMFTTRNVDNHTTCVPYENSGSVINLKFESFAARPSPAGTAPPQQGAS
jgi:hypothetical protein